MLDVRKKIDIIKRPPTEEIVTDDELSVLLETNTQPKHYIGLEVSGRLHLGSLIIIGFKINDFLNVGIKCKVFLADWHALINDKIDSLDDIKQISRYYTNAFNVVCPGAEVLSGSDLYNIQNGYWSDLIKVAKNMSLPRTIRTLTIMGRTEKDKIDLAKLLYPSMQATDMHSLDIDIAHSGMDQRKIHMVVREVFPKLKWKVPIAIHHRLLPSLLGSYESNTINKMSKSNLESGIFMHDTDDVIKKKIEKSWCEIGNKCDNPLLEIARSIIYHEFKEIKIERQEKFGGDKIYYNYTQLESDFINKKVHPIDLKNTVSRYLIKIIKPIRNKLSPYNNIFEITDGKSNNNSH